MPRMRVENQAQRTRQNSESGWGLQVSDVTAVGDVLHRLNTGTWLDPSNPFAWHLLAYFSRIVGDLDRSESALINARAALEFLFADDAALQPRARSIRWLVRAEVGRKAAQRGGGGGSG